MRAILLTAALVVAAPAGCGTDEDGGSGGQKEDIVIKCAWDITGGKITVIESKFVNAQEDFVNDINEKGGIRGHKIDYECGDTQYDNDVSVAMYEDFMAQDDWDRVSALVFSGSNVTEVLAPMVKRDQRPMMTTGLQQAFVSPQPMQNSVTIPEGVDIPTLLPEGVSIEPSDADSTQERTLQIDLPGAPYIFIGGMDYGSQIRTAVQFVEQKIQGGRKIAFAYDNGTSIYTTAPIPAGKLLAYELGVGMAPDIHPMLGSTYSEVEQVVMNYFADGKNTNVEWIWVGNTYQTAIYFARAAFKYGPSDVKIFVNRWAFNEEVFDDCAEGLDPGSTNPCMERYFGVTALAAYGDTTWPLMTDVVRLHDAYHPGDSASANTYYVYGYWRMLRLKIAYERLIDAGKEITGSNVNAILEQFENVNVGGLTPPLTMSPSDHRPFRTTRIFSVGASGLLRFEEAVTIEDRPEWQGW